MYNRYIRNDQGTYTRIPEEDPRQSQGTSPRPVIQGLEVPAAADRRLPTGRTALPRRRARTLRRPGEIPLPPAEGGRTASPACSGICWTSST